VKVAVLKCNTYSHNLKHCNAHMR